MSDSKEELYMLIDLVTDEVKLFYIRDKAEEASEYYRFLGPTKIYVLKEEE